MANEPSEQEKNEYFDNQERWARNAGLRNGSKCTVLQNFESYASGFCDIYADHLAKYVGKTGVSDGIIDRAHGVILTMEDSIVCNFPFFVLSVNSDEQAD